MSKPVAVLISDVHYSLPTLNEADIAMQLAISKANELDVVLIVAGDLHDTKANLRAECVNRMLYTFSFAKYRPIVLIGNHDRINEKSFGHSLEFLDNCAHLVSLTSYHMAGIGLFSYGSDANRLVRRIKDSGKKTFIMHQGIEGSYSGDYIQDKTALKKEDVAGLRIISGHYHRRQTIPLPDGGQWDYIGNPYTLNFGEAHDPEKGFQILMDDGSLEFVPTEMRKHVIIEGNSLEGLLHTTGANDIVWVKIRDTKENLRHYTKSRVAKQLGLVQDFRLELIPTDTQQTSKNETPLVEGALLDSLIDNSINLSIECKYRLKDIWKALID